MTTCDLRLHPLSASWMHCWKAHIANVERHSTTCHGKTSFANVLHGGVAWQI
jgi:hypothetical protein